jgi:FkbM family methyltransferase
MKQLIKRKLSNLLHPLIIRLGYNKKLKEFNPLEAFFSLLKEIGYDPVHIVDVGANHGSWTRTALKYFPNAYFTLLEPQKWLEQYFKDLLESNPKVKFYNYGAGSASGSFKFTIGNRDDTSSFRLTEDEAKKQGFSQIDVEVVTLNEFIVKQNLLQPDVIKIDAEGFDLEVLKGSSSFFEKTEIFLVEVAVVAKEIENSFLRVLTYMDQNGYKLFDITELNRPFEPKILWLAELVFIRKDGIIDSKKIV